MDLGDKLNKTGRALKSGITFVPKKIDSRVLSPTADYSVRNLPTGVKEAARGILGDGIVEGLKTEGSRTRTAISHIIAYLPPVGIGVLAAIDHFAGTDLAIGRPVAGSFADFYTHHPALAWSLTGAGLAGIGTSFAASQKGLRNRVVQYSKGASNSARNVSGAVSSYASQGWQSVKGAGSGAVNHFSANRWFYGLTGAAAGFAAFVAWGPALSTYNLVTSPSNADLKRVERTLEDKIAGVQRTPGPRGLKGESGPQGPQGEPGDDYVLTKEDRRDIGQIAAGYVTPAAPTEQPTATPTAVPTATPSQSPLAQYVDTLRSRAQAGQQVGIAFYSDPESNCYKAAMFSFKQEDGRAVDAKHRTFRFDNASTLDMLAGVFGLSSLAAQSIEAACEAPDAFRDASTVVVGQQFVSASEGNAGKIANIIGSEGRYGK